MFGTTIPWRALIIPAAAVGLGVLVQRGSHHQPPLRPQPPLPVFAVLPPVVVEVPTFDLRGALAMIGHRVIAAHPAAIPHPMMIPAEGPCERPDIRERNDLAAQLVSWVNATYGDEQPADALDLSFGCLESDGRIIVEGSVDRMATGSERMTVMRSWVWDFTPEHVTVIAERTSTPSNDWMEWADEGTLTVNALIDLDHDGVRDVVITNEDHEGGAVRSSYAVSVKRGAKLEPVVHMSGVLAVSLEGHRVVLELGENLDHPAFRCIGSRLTLIACRAASAARVTNQQLRIANQLVYEPAVDRETLVDQLQTLDVSSTESAPILAAATTTTPMQRAQRHVAAFLDQRPDGELADLGPEADLVSPIENLPFETERIPEIAKALATLGAERALVREVRALAP